MEVRIIENVKEIAKSYDRMMWWDRPQMGTLEGIAGRFGRIVSVTSLVRKRYVAVAIHFPPQTVNIPIEVLYNQRSNPSSNPQSFSRSNTAGPSPPLDKSTSDHANELSPRKNVSPAFPPRVPITVVGIKVQARYRGKRNSYPGVVSRIRDDGTYDITYDDGEVERGIKWDQIEVINGNSELNKEMVKNNAIAEEEVICDQPRQHSNQDEGANEGHDSHDAPRTALFDIEPLFSEGCKVEARYRGKSRYYPGTIRRLRLGGRAYDITYEDGEKEFSVESRLIRLRSCSSTVSRSPSPQKRN
jgi:hypothetical protein